MLNRCVQFFYGATLFTLPMSGVGLLALFSGRDWGFGLQPAWVFLFLAIVCQTLAHFSDPGSGSRLSLPVSDFSQTRLHRWVLRGILAIVLVTLLSGWGLKLAPSGEASSETWLRFWKQVLQLVIMLAFVLWPLYWTRGPERWRFTILMLAAGAGFQVLYGLLQGVHYYLPWGILPPLEKVFTSNPAILSGSEDLYLGNTFRNIPRLRGTICEPLYLGNYLLMVMPFLIWKKREIPWGRGLVLGAGLLLLLTWSRGAWMGALWQVFLCGVALVFVSRPSGPILRLARKSRWALFLVGLVLVSGFLFSSWSVFELPRERLLQTFSQADWSNLTRVYSMQAGWRAFLLSPWVGVGWGQFAFHFPVLVDPMGLQSQFSWPVVNNFALKILAETGLLGFLTFAAISVGMMRGGFQLYRRTLSLGLFAALIAVSGVWLQLLTFSQYNLPHIWLAVGLLGAMMLEQNTNRGNESDLPKHDARP